MFSGIELNQLYLFLILIGSVVLLFTEWIRIDLTAILIIVMLSITGSLNQRTPFPVLAASLLSCWQAFLCSMGRYIIQGCQGD